MYTIHKISTPRRCPHRRPSAKGREGSIFAHCRQRTAMATHHYIGSSFEIRSASRKLKSINLNSSTSKRFRRSPSPIHDPDIDASKSTVARSEDATSPCPFDDAFEHLAKAHRRFSSAPPSFFAPQVIGEYVIQSHRRVAGATLNGDSAAAKSNAAK
jgi:hypothetical protein